MYPGYYHLQSLSDHIFIAVAWECKCTQVSVYRISLTNTPTIFSQGSRADPSSDWDFQSLCPSLSLIPRWAWDLHCREQFSRMESSDLDLSLSQKILGVTCCALFLYLFIFLISISIYFYFYFYFFLFLFLADHGLNGEKQFHLPEMSWVFQHQKCIQGHIAQRLLLESGFYFWVYLLLFF